MRTGKEKADQRDNIVLVTHDRVLGGATSRGAGFSPEFGGGSGREVENIQNIMHIQEKKGPIESDDDGVTSQFENEE